MTPGAAAALLALALAGAAGPQVRFADVTAEAGIRFVHDNGAAGGKLLPETMGAGVALFDADADGDLDLVVATNGGPPHLFRNDGGNRNRWLAVRLIGREPNRDALGAVVRVTTAAGRQWDMVRSGGSYCSASDPALTFGLGSAGRVDLLEVEWPSGARHRLAGLPADRIVTLVEE